MAVAPSRHGELKLQGWEAHVCVSLVGHKPSDSRALPLPEAKPNHGSHPPGPGPAGEWPVCPPGLPPFLALSSSMASSMLCLLTANARVLMADGSQLSPLWELASAEELPSPESRPLLQGSLNRMAVVNLVGRGA